MLDHTQQTEGEDGHYPYVRPMDTVVTRLSIGPGTYVAGWGMLNENSPQLSESKASTYAPSEGANTLQSTYGVSSMPAYGQAGYPTALPPIREALDAPLPADGYGEPNAWPATTHSFQAGGPTDVSRVGDLAPTPELKSVEDCYCGSRSKHFKLFPPVWYDRENDHLLHRSLDVCVTMMTCANPNCTRRDLGKVTSIFAGKERHEIPVRTLDETKTRPKVRLFVDHAECLVIALRDPIAAGLEWSDAYVPCIGCDGLQHVMSLAGKVYGVIEDWCSRAYSLNRNRPADAPPRSRHHLSKSARGLHSRKVTKGQDKPSVSSGSRHKSKSSSGHKKK